MARRSVVTEHPTTRESTELLEALARHEGLSIPQIAYVLATAFHESRLGLWMVDHAVRPADCRRVGGGGRAGGVAEQRRFRGRGFARLTGRDAYAAWGEQLDLPLLTEPDLAACPEVAATILVRGMRTGAFTGHRLADHIDDDRIDYVGARQVMAPADRPVRVAGYARGFEAELSGASLDEPTVSDVVHAQRHLARIGWPLAADGVLGRHTRRAISDFQAGYCRQMLRVDGYLDTATRIAIETCASADGHASDHFRFFEFRTAGAPRFADPDPGIRIDRELVQGLERYRQVVGGPVRIDRGNRSPVPIASLCDRYGDAHLSGRAVHVHDPCVPVEVVRRLESFSSIGHRHGLAVHLGVGGSRASREPHIYPLDDAPPCAVPSTGQAGGGAADPGGPLADAGHRGRPILLP